MFNSPQGGAAWSSLETHVTGLGGAVGVGKILRDLIEDEERCERCWIDAEVN
jgi:hypothetical protein